MPGCSTSLGAGRPVGPLFATAWSQLLLAYYDTSYARRFSVLVVHSLLVEQPA